ncbi:hypothetical protein ACFLS1_07040 [Verrucomicrobiota bacterium]
MDEKRTLDFWYAVNNTEIIRMPSRQLETFGATVLNYHLVSELMDTANQIRVREGRMQASRPQIITPEKYSQNILEGFGEEAEKYIEWLKEHEKELRVLQYGYKLKKEEFSEHVITDNIETVVERVKNDTKQKDDPLSAIVLGVDEPWDVCLIKLFWEVIQSSAPKNIRDLERKRLFDNTGGVPRAVRNEIESAFLAASRNTSLIKALGEKLQNYNLFEEYQDRFFSLVKTSKK